MSDKAAPGVCEKCGLSLSAAFVCREVPCPREDRFWNRQQGAKRVEANLSGPDASVPSDGGSDNS